MAILKLQTNLPLEGRLKFADFQKSKREDWSDQIKLKGDFHGPGYAGEADSLVYLNIAVVNDLVKIGVVEDAGNDAEGNPQFRVIHEGPIRLTKKEEGKRKFTEVELVDGTAPMERKPAPKNQTVQAPDDGPATDRTRWRALKATYEGCFKIAEGVLPEKSPLTDVVAATATLFIQAMRDHLMVYPGNGTTKHEPKPEPPKPVPVAAPAFDKMPPELSEDDDPNFLPF